MFDSQNTHAQLHHDFEKSLIHRLQREWQRATDKAVARHTFLKRTLHLPLITVSEMHRCLGLWLPERNEIRLGTDLMHQGRWDSILEVFLHETAHQIASLFPQYPTETSHGPLFKQCCQLIGANPKASGSYQTLKERVWGDSNGQDENDRIMLKVKKLMSLASSANRHEAEAAAAKASKLIAHYNLDIIENDKARGFESIIITEPALKISQPSSVAASILTRFYFVKGIWIYSFMPEKKRWGKALEISGTPTNLKIADYVFHYILRYAEMSWKQYKKENPSCRSRSGYMTGVLSGFFEKLDDQQRQTAEMATASSTCVTQGNDRAPMIIEDDRLIRYHETRYPNTVTTRRCHTSASRSAYNSGKAQGKALTISKGITGSDGNGGKLLGR